MIREFGPLRAYSTRSMERAIGNLSKSINSNVSSGRNASNIIEGLAINKILGLTIDIDDELDVIRPKPYKPSSFWKNPSGDSFDSQYWEPFKLNVSASSVSVGTQAWSLSTVAFLSCLKKFYQFTEGPLFQPLDLSSNTIDLAGRAWIDHTVYNSEFYRHYRREYRRNNSIVKFIGYNGR